MTRKFLDDLRAEIDTLFADNTSGLISPADVRQIARDTVDSTVADDATIYRNSASGSADLGTQITPTPIASIADTQSVDANMDGCTADPVAGTFTSGTVAGREYYLVMQVSVVLTLNAQFRLGVTIDGILSDFQSVVNGQGAGKPVSGSLLALMNDQAASAVVQCLSLIHI